MRRRLAAAVFTAGVLAVAGCGDDGGNGGDGGDGGRSTQEICDELEQTIEPLQAEVLPLVQEAAQANAQGDQAAAAEAAAEMDSIVSQITDELRSSAEAASDEEFRAALGTLADEFENLSGALQGGELPEGQAIQDAGDRVDEFCA